MATQVKVNKKIAKRPNAAPPARSVASESAPARLAREYWRESRRPLASLAFVLPLLVIYESGQIVLGAQAVRNGADVWLRQILDALGFGQYFLLPALTVALLLAWHHVSGQRWRLSAAVLYVMFAECAVLALGLCLAARFQALVANRWLVSAPVLAISAPAAARAIGYLGAGVYEEMLFRLLPVPPLLAGAKHVFRARHLAVAGTVALTSLAFAGAHYLGPRGEAFDAFSFTFRFVAGTLFALLLVYRGFGVAAGTHALYDIFVAFG